MFGALARRFYGFQCAQLVDAVDSGRIADVASCAYRRSQPVRCIEIMIYNRHYAPAPRALATIRRISCAMDSVLEPGPKIAATPTA